jgi:metal-dependent amidase/aminoacylase/carboxypeptidase family protein
MIPHWRKNDPLEATAGKENVSITPAVTGADFSYYQEKIPGLYFFLGGAPKANIRDRAASYTWFYIDESGFLLGMKDYPT